MSITPKSGQRTRA